MKLKINLDSVDELSEDFKSLYTEKDGKFILTGVEGMRTEDDVRRIQTGATKERDEHKKTKEKYKPFEAFLDDVEGTLAKLDEYDTLKAAAGGKLDQSKIDEIVEQKSKIKLAPLERQAKKDAETIASLTQQVETFQANERRRLVREAVRAAAIQSKMVDTAVEDAEFLAERLFEITEDGKIVTKDGVGVTPGVDPTVWLTDMQPKRPHWWPASQGGGGKGAGGKGGFGGPNPFSKDGWNLTAQAALIRENRDRAEQMARAAGTTIGGPPPK